MADRDLSNPVSIVTLVDDPQFTQDLSAICASVEPLNVVLDFSAVTHLTSANLAALLMARKRLQSQDRRLCLCGVSDRVWGLFTITGLNQLFDHHTDAAAATASLQR